MAAIQSLKLSLTRTGYQDSGADIAFALQSQSNIVLLTPRLNPDPSNQSHWTFPDTETGILSALSRGATHLWANTILFASHPLQTSRVVEFEDDVRIIGQPPLMVELFDDKEYVNNRLRRDGRFTMPKSWTVESEQDLEVLIGGEKLTFPIVGKPVRGRGSYGVKVCHDSVELNCHVRALLNDSPRVMLEEYLAGEEATITVFPPSPEDGKDDYWASPIVTRFNHQDGVAPFNSIIAVSSNSRVLTSEEFEKDVNYKKVTRECEEVARLLKVTMAMRVDVRRSKEDGEFTLFDINMKPVSSISHPSSSQGKGGMTNCCPRI